MRILGVDPGSLKTGVGVIETDGSRYRLVHFEIIANKSSASMPDRLSRIYASLKDVLVRFQPEVLSLENVFFGRDAQALVKIGEARACAMLAASESGIPVIEYPPAKVKKAVSGNGRATKEQIQHMIKVLLGLDRNPPSDGADALAVAICHVHYSKRLSVRQGAI